MKLEREPVFGHVTLSHKSDPKSFDYNELSLDSNGLKSGKVAKENQNVHVHDLKDSKIDVSHLVYLVNDGNEIASSQPDCFMEDGNVKSQMDDLSDDFLAPFSKSSSEIEVLEKDLECYTDKSAIECELPEFQICYKENGYSSVKDICIDEGVNSQDKILFESGVDKRSLCTFVFPDQDIDKQIDKEEVDVGVFRANDLKSSAKDESNEEFVCQSKELRPRVGTNLDATEKTVNDISQDKIFPEDVILMREMEEEEKRQTGTPSRDGNAAVEVQMSSDNDDETTKTTLRGVDHATEKLDTDNEEESITTASDSVSDESKSSSSTVDELSYNSKVEKRRITFDFDSSASVSTSKEDQNGIPITLDTENTTPADTSTTGTEITPRNEAPKDSICEHDAAPNALEDGSHDSPVPSSEAQHKECSQSGVLGCAETPSSSDNNESPPSLASQLQHVMAKEDNPESSSSGRRPSTDVPIVDDGLSHVQSVSGHFQYGVGESSFSATGPMSGRINYSGPVPYSGSISLRSDSSTTSTRSFAFPILQSEWNSSPVRMAKADRRHFRKTRGWRQGLLCCRF